MGEWTMWIEIVGWTGVGLYVIAYYLVSAGRVNGRSKRYQYLNLAGATGVAINAFYYGATPSAVVNVVWFGIASATLIGVLRGGEEADPGRPRTREGRDFSRVLFFAGGLLAVFGLGFAVLVTSPRPPSPLQPIRVYTSHWPPFVNAESPDGGPLVVLVREAFRRAGYEPVFDFTTWERAQAELQDGPGFAAFPFIRDEARETSYVMSKPLMSFTYVLFHRADMEVDEETLHAWSTLDHQAENDDTQEGPPTWRLGAARGYAVWQPLAERLPIVARFETIGDAFEALASGEIDFVPESRLAGEYVLMDPNVAVDASSIRAMEVAVDGSAAGSREQLHVMAPRTTAGRALIDRLNKALESLEAEGRLATLQRQLGDGGHATHAAQSTVRTNGVVSATDAQGTRYMLAQGTRAVVLAWPDAFGSAGDVPGERAGASGAVVEETGDRCQVKVLNGPLRGRVLAVDPGGIELEVGEVRR